MNRHTIPLGRILGIPIGLDYSWFLIFGLITWTMAVGYYPAEFKNWPAVQYWIMGAATAIMLFVSVLLHELGHSTVAMSYKIRVRSITLLIFGGISRIEAEPPSATAQFWISIAGPAVSFALAGLFFLLQPVFKNVAPLLALGKYLVYINIVLGLFNLIPGFPLDGGGVFRAVVWGIPGHPDGRQPGAIHRLCVHRCGRVANVDRQPYERHVDRLHRLVPGKCRQGTGSATGRPRYTGGPQSVSGDESALYGNPCRYYLTTPGGRSHSGQWSPQLCGQEK